MKLKNVFSLIAVFIIFSAQLFAQDVQQQNNSENTSAAVQNETTSQTQTPQQDSAPVKKQTTAPVTSKPKTLPEDVSIEEQFIYAIEKSSNFQDYKVIKQSWISNLKINTLDSLNSLKSNLAATKSIVKEKEASIDALKAEILTIQADLKEKNSFKFFGIMVSKTGYDSIMWGIILGLIVALGFLFFAFKRSYSVTVQTRKDLVEVKDEFETFRKKALKSKEEAVRQLYDELSKYKNRK